MAKDFQKIAEQMLPLLGGKENIVFLTHCVTRLRFNLADREAIQLDTFKKVNGVLGAQWSGDQLQIIIGQDVADAYQAMCRAAGISGQAASPGEKKKKKFKLSDILDMLAGCMTPLIPLLLGLGLVKVLVMFLEMTHLLSTGSSTYAVLTALGDAGLYFLPIFVGATAARKFETNIALSMWICALMIHPAILAASTAETALHIFGIPIYQAGYTYTLVPSILVVWVMSYVERFITEHSPKVIRNITGPLLTALIMTPLTLCLLAPLGNMIGIYVSAVLNWLYNTAGFLAVGLMAAFCPFIVMTGMHTGLLPIMVQSFASLGCEGFMLPSNVISNINQGIASIAVGIKTKDSDLRAEALSCGVSAVVAGVTEPAMFGVTIKYRTPMYAAMIGSFAGGLIAGLGKATAYAMTTSNALFALPAFLSNDLSNIIWMAAAIAIGAVITFVLTLILYKTNNIQDTEIQGKPEETNNPAAESGVVYAPLTGKIIPLEDIPDPVFASGIVGWGCGVEPEDDTVYAPFDGKVVMVAESKHAVGITGKEGTEVLIHVGIDTVKMNGNGFRTFVSAGQTVKKGERLLQFHREKIREAGYPAVTAVLVNGVESADAVKILSRGQIQHGDPLMKV